MENELSDIERDVLRVIQSGFPESRNPFNDMARQIGISCDELLCVLKKWKQEGKIRRIGAIVNHFQVGLSAGGMVVWEVEAGRVEDVGQIFAGFKEVSHAYERRLSSSWPFNLYTMVHGASSEDVEQTVARMSESSGVSNYRILVTEKELKKVPPTYIR